VIRFANLGSGSSGNATLVEASEGITTTRLLVDCGLTLRDLAVRLARHGLAPEDLDAVFVTHEHADHVGCALSLARRHGVALWMSRGTWHAVQDFGEPIERLHHVRDGDVVAIGDLQLAPFTVPHDAREPLQLACSDGARKFGILTDAGSITPHMVAGLARCDALLLECNHDPALLAASSYPASVKARIAGPHGHLANATSAALLAACRHAGLRQVVAAHLSERNNRPELARAALAAPLGCCPDDIAVADPLCGSAWLAV
jgi:phosphoribosyl 1,2-cyclic phosphodiesterase